MKSKGLGDDIKKITSATRLDQLTERIAKLLDEDCGCDERQDKLNKLFPYKQNDTSIPTELIHECIDVWEDIKTGVAKNVEAKKKMIELHNEIYKSNYKTTSNCGTCLNSCYQGIKKIVEKFKT